ncbi:MAG: hypothetical protein ACREV1_07355, partial [Gammaproteobacteria bacterium]
LKVGAGLKPAPTADLKAAIFGHPEFTAFNAAVTALFGQWKAANAPRLHAIAQGDHPKALIETLSESLLDTVRQVGASGHELSRHTGTDCRYPVDRDVSSSVVPSVWVPAFPAGTTSKSVDSTTVGPTVRAPLIDAYDVYQHLMDYWAATMQDDVYLIVHAGWVEAAKPRLIVETKEQRSKEQPDFTVGKQKFKSDLVPAALLIARYFAAEQAAIEALEAELGTLEQQLDELKEEHGGESGPLKEIVDEKGKIRKKAVAARLKEIAHDIDATYERKLLNDYAALIDKQADAKSRLKAAQEKLEAKVAAKYGKLTEAEIKALVVNEKWLAALAADVQSELDRLSQALTGRVRQLADRYTAPLPQLTEDVEILAARVDEHLKKMGALWN